MSKRRNEAVKLRLDGYTVAMTSHKTGLSAPTVAAAWKAFREGGWAAVPVKPRGRIKGQANVLSDLAQQCLWEQLYSTVSCDAPGWNSAMLAERLRECCRIDVSQRAIEHWWAGQGLKHVPWDLNGLAKRRSQQGRWYRQSIMPLVPSLVSPGYFWQGGVRVVRQSGQCVYQIYLHGQRGRLWMRCFKQPPTASDYLAAMQAIANQGPAALAFQGAWFAASPEVGAWLDQQMQFWLVPVPANMNLAI